MENPLAKWYQPWKFSSVEKRDHKSKKRMILPRGGTRKPSFTLSSLVPNITARPPRQNSQPKYRKTGPQGSKKREK
jgi:hypothetical protein